MTGERMVPQKLYKCATCGMADDGYCICEFCIKSCHEGHEISMFDKEGVGYGFCDCGEEASQDKRSCNLLKSTKDIFPDSIREKLEKKFEVEGLPSVVVMKADGTLVSEDAVTDIANSRGEAPWGEELNLVKEWKEYDEKANSFCEIIKGSSLVKADESTKPVDEALAGKDIVLVYFSAHWCPPCRRFTPLLKNFYQDVSEKGVELIFVSSDSSKEDMLNYMKESHGDWYAFEHESKIGQKLSKTFRVSGIPTLVALKTDGTIIDRNARGSIEKGASIISEWKSV